MSYFIEVPYLGDLEKREKWEDARNLLYKIWESDKLNSDKLIRLLSECWYVLSLWDCCINTENMYFKTFQNTFIECVEFGLLNFKSDSRFLCIAGYMISMLPHLCYIKETGNSYLEWEQRGIEMLQKSSDIDSDDAVCKIFNLGFKDDLSQYNEAKIQLSSKLSELFPNETVVEKYFQGVLSCRLQ